MRVRETSHGFAVELPIAVRPTLYLADRLIPPPRLAPTRTVQLPGPALDSAIREVAMSSLVLPQGSFDSGAMWLSPSIEPGIGGIWREDRLRGLVLPSAVGEGHRFERVMRARVLAAPSTVGLLGDAAVMSAIAWKVLTRAPLDTVVIAGCGATAIELINDSTVCAHGVVENMDLGALGVRLHGEVAAGHPVFDPKCPRWVVGEVAAALSAEDLRCPAEPPIESQLEEDVLRRLLFADCLVDDDTPPTRREVFRALWLLHEGFRFAGPTGVANADPSPDQLLSFITALGYSSHSGGGWIRRMERARHVFAADDSHPAVRDTMYSPSAFRSAFNEVVGLELTEWLGGMWLLLGRYQVMADDGRFPLLTMDDLVEDGIDELTEGRAGRLSNAFVEAFHCEALDDLLQLGHAIRAENPTYGGIGSLPQRDSLAMRNAPFVLMPGDLVVPLGADLIVHHTVTLPRLRVPARLNGRGANNTLGKMFEAYVADLATTASGRHHGLSSVQIDAGVPAQARRPDALIGYVVDYLAVEVGLQTLSRQVALGDTDMIREMCTRYHSKMDQADGLAEHLGALLDQHGLIPAGSYTGIVVVDIPAHQTPALFDELRQQHPDRDPKFLVGIDEFEHLIAMGKSWSIPSLIAGWRNTADDITLGTHLSEQQRWSGCGGLIQPESFAQWVATVPFDSSQPDAA